MKRLVWLVLVLAGVIVWLLAVQGVGREDTRSPAPTEAPSALVVLAPDAEAPTLTSPATQQGEPQRRAEIAASPAEPTASSGEEPAPVVFHGLVRDALSGAPIRAARIALARAQRGVPSAELSSEEIEREAASDAAGRFELAPARLGVARVVAPGYGPYVLVVDCAHATPERAEVVELLAEAALEVCVTDAEGLGLEGVAVELAWREPATSGAGGLFFVRAPPSWTARTDAAGVVRFEGLPAEATLAWTVRAPDGPEVREGRLALAPGERRRLELVLAGGARVSGRVRDENGVAVPALPVYLSPASNGPHQGQSQRELHATSDASGAFEFLDLAFDTFTLGLGAGAGEFTTPEVEVVVDRADVERDLVVTRGLFVSGRILASEEELGEIKNISARALGSTRFVEGSLEGSSFRIGPLVPGEYQVGAGGISWGSELVQVTAGAREVELRLLPSGEVRVRAGAHAGKLTLAILDLERGGTHFVIGASGATCRLAQGAHALLATAGDGGIAFVPRLEVDPARAPQEVMLEFAPAAHCTVVNGADRRLALRLLSSGELSPLPQSSQLIFGLASGASGTVLVPAGALTVELMDDGRIVVAESVQLLPGERRRIVLEPR